LARLDAAFAGHHIEMVRLRASLKSGLLATVALGAAAMTQPVLADQPARHPTEIGAIVEAADVVAVAAEDGSRPAGPLAGLAALAAAILAVFSRKRLLRLLKQAAPVARAAAAAAVAAPAAAARAVGRAVAAPFRWILALASLALFSLLGFGMFDIEWAAGALAGVAAVLLFWISSARLSRAAARIRRSGVAG
jgi:hypothetical protein